MEEEKSLRVSNQNPGKRLFSFSHGSTSTCHFLFFFLFISTQREIIQVDSVCCRRRGGGNLVFLGISPTHRRRDRKVLFSR
jgi:hypothetical protein